MKKSIVFSVCWLFGFSAFAQVRENADEMYNDYGGISEQTYQENKSNMENNLLLKTIRSPLKNYGDERTARNILIVKEVADFKLDDEKLQDEFAKVANSREYAQKMQRIMDKLSNKKLRNTKNKEVIRILDEAGKKIYNLLAD